MLLYFRLQLRQYNRMQKRGSVHVVHMLFARMRTTKSVQCRNIQYFLVLFCFLQCQHNESGEMKGVECEIEETPGG